MRPLRRLRQNQLPLNLVITPGHPFSLNCVFYIDSITIGTTEGEALTSALKQQVEFYFSRQNLATDTYLLSQVIHYFVALSLIFAMYPCTLSYTLWQYLTEPAVRPMDSCILLARKECYLYDRLPPHHHKRDYHRGRLLRIMDFRSCHTICNKDKDQQRGSFVATNVET